MHMAPAVCAAIPKQMWDGIPNKPVPCRTIQLFPNVISYVFITHRPNNNSNNNNNNVTPCGTHTRLSRPITDIILYS